jgi:hypothetical protein
VAQQAHPTHEHYLPLLYAAGAARVQRDAPFFQHRFPGGIDLDALRDLGLNPPMHIGRWPSKGGADPDPDAYNAVILQ